MSKINILRIVLVFIAGGFFTWFGIEFWTMRASLKEVVPVANFVVQQVNAQLQAQQKNK